MTQYDYYQGYSSSFSHNASFVVDYPRPSFEELTASSQVGITAKIVLMVSYSLMIPVCGIGNLLLCYVIYRFRRMRNTTNLLIGNLALSDFLVAAVVAPFNFFYYVHDTWPFGEGMCITVAYLKATSFFVSINSLLAIAIDRYIIIMHPLKPRMTTKTAFIVLFGIWVISLAIAIPSAIYSKVIHPNLAGDPIKCTEMWTNLDAMQAYALILICGEFILPLTVMSVVYLLIARKLWFRRVGHVTEQQEIAAESSKRRTIRLLIIVVALFAFCWAPYHFLAIFRDIVFPSYQHSHWTTFLTIFYLVEALAMSNSMFNTFIYVVFNANVRKYVLQIPDSCRRKPREKTAVRYWQPLSSRSCSVRSSQMRTNTSSISTRLTINLNRYGPHVPPSGPQSPITTIAERKC